MNEEPTGPLFSTSSPLFQALREEGNNRDSTEGRRAWGNRFRSLQWRVLGTGWELIPTPRTMPWLCGVEGFPGPRKWLGSICASLILPSLSTECPNQAMDIVFLIDGSGSIGQNEFKQMKDFVRAVMGQFEGTNTLVKIGPWEWDGGGSASGEDNLGSGSVIFVGCWLNGPVLWWGSRVKVWFQHKAELSPDSRRSPHCI